MGTSAFFEIYLNIPINCYGPKTKKKTLTHQHLPIERIWWLVGRSVGRSTTLVVLCQLNRMEEVGSWLWLMAMYHITSRYEKGLIPFVMGHDEQARNSLVMRVHTYPFSFRRFTHLLPNSMEKYWKCSSPPLPPKKKTGGISIDVWWGVFQIYISGRDICKLLALAL